MVHIDVFPIPPQTLMAVTATHVQQLIPVQPAVMWQLLGLATPVFAPPDTRTVLALVKVTLLELRCVPVVKFLWNALEFPPFPHRH